MKYTGYIPHEDLSNILSIGYCGIAPTVHLKKNYINDEYVGVIEGFNLTVVEYLGMGIPVVISNSGGMPELITDDCGIIVSSLEDDIVKELESGEVPLDDAINKYTEAMKLAKECSDKLNKVSEKVNKIMTENGKLEDFTVSE